MDNCVSLEATDRNTTRRKSTLATFRTHLIVSHLLYGPVSRSNTNLKKRLVANSMKKNASGYHLRETTGDCRGTTRDRSSSNKLERLSVFPFRTHEFVSRCLPGRPHILSPHEADVPKIATLFACPHIHARRSQFLHLSVQFVRGSQ